MCDRCRVQCDRCVVFGPKPYRPRPHKSPEEIERLLKQMLDEPAIANAAAEWGARKRWGDGER